MPTFSGEMELRWSGLNSHGQRRYERNFELLKQKTEYLYDMRDSVRDEQIKELMLGTIPSKESHKWLKKERDLQPRLNHLLIFHRERHEDLITTLDEVTQHLENFPFSTIGAKTYGVFEKAKKTEAETKGQSDFIVHAQDKEAARSAKFVASLDEVNPVLGHETCMGHDDMGFKPVQDGFTRIFDDYSVAQSQDSPRIGRKTKDVKHNIKADTRDESTVEVVAQGKKATQRMKGKLAVEKDGRFEALKSDVMAVKHRGSFSGDIEYQSEIVPAAVTKSVLDADQVPTSSIETVIEDEMMCPQQSYTEYEIQRIHEREGKLNLHVKGSVGENRRMLPIHETVPSQPEVESQMNVKQSVGPIDRQMNVLTSGLDVETVIEDEMMRPQQSYTSPLDEYEIQCIHEREGESNVHVKGSVGENRRMLPILETVPSQPEVESQMNVLTSDLDVKTSTGRTVLKILGYMNDVTAGKVGVHGIGGIGKTSVLEALINHIETKRIFDSIMFVSVSRYWSIRKIQNEVLRQLSLSCEDSETDTQVAERLFQVLSEKKFLLLLDDVWEQIHLEAMGIPDPCSVKGSKILMASKNLNVFCDMDVIEVETMSREEAWELFSKQVGGINSPDIQPFARAIANGCGGLPLLIIVTGKALTGEDNVTVWEHASRKFSLPGTTGTYQTEDVIQLLKFSFDRLRDYDTKSCFLHCSLFSKDREVTIFELIEYCIQEGVIDGSGGDVHKRGLDIVDDLKRASLLQDTKDDNSINMHDLIRDLALGILSSVAEGSQYLLRTGSLKEPSNPASSLSPLENSRLNIPEGYQFLLRAGAGLTEPPSEEEWRQAKMIFLMDNDLCTLPERPSCPELLVLFLQRNYRLRMIPPSFFDSMTSLKVLNLSKTRVKSLPETLFKLEDLQVLILRDCERLVMLPSEVRHLKHLEVLDLQGTEINELPDEIGELTSLRYLKVSFYGSIDYSEYVKLPNELISSGILSRLKALKTLSIVVYPGDQRWCKNVKYVVTDISNLTDLSSLCFHFPEVELLEPFLQTSEAWNSRRLTEFKFVIGHDVKSITSRVPNFVECDYYRQGQCLRFVNGEKISDDVRKVLARSTAFHLDHHLTICSLSDFGVSNINGLKLCIISECPKMETVIDGKELTMTVFSSLENLKIYYLWNLTSIWEGIVPEGSFAGLKILSVCACPKLKNVFSSSMIDFVSKLEELVVEDCPVIEEIILEGEIIRSDRILLPSLKKLTLHDLPELVNIWKSAWPSLEHISFYNCPKLKKIGWGSELKRNIREIEAEKSWWDELEWEDIDLQSDLQDHLTTICEDDL